MYDEFNTYSKPLNREYKTYSMDLCGRTLSVDIGRVAAQANGAAFMHYGDTTVLCTATASKEPREGIDFFPLSVEYEEKLYAVGKIPGGFNKREGKPSEHAILTSRVIDRPMRPLFPKDYRNDVTLNNLVLSVDPDCAPEVTAMIGASLATAISDIPFDGPCAATNVGLIGGELIMNPTNDQKQVSDLSLTVASTRDKVIMIEAGANEVSDEVMIDAIYKAHEVNQKIIAWMDQIVAEVGKPKHSYQSCAVPEELFAAIRAEVPQEEMEEAVFCDDKQQRDKNIDAITIDSLQEVLHDLRSNIKTYQAAIDSLNRENRQLQAEKNDALQRYRKASDEASKLQKDNHELNEKVSQASRLEAIDIDIQPLNKRGRKTGDKDKVSRLRINFAIARNIMAATGEKKIYVCIVKPDGSTLVKDRSNTFTLDGKECYYSLQQIIDYTGNNEKMYFNWKVEEYLTAGRYDVIIYADTQLIGSQPFELND